MSVYCRLAANSIQNQVKKGRCPKTFRPGLSEKLHFGNHFQMLLICIFQFWLLRKCVQSVLILACSDEYLQVLGLTQPTVLTLEWIRGLFFGFAICICSESTFDYTTKHSKWHFSVKTQITCKITVFME